jgi:ABC-type dipeptide/oligopeptide/nickel transport system ATPase component
LNEPQLVQLKKIDLHIHTKASPFSDAHFDFSLSKLKEYVDKLNIDCIAITNHNLFDLQQFSLIVNNVSAKVLPGIEIDLERGHILLISENCDLEEFDSKCKQVENIIKSKTDYLTVHQLREIFIDIGKYLLIPHYDKHPSIRPEIIDALKPHVSCGEVTSPKKFAYCLKETSSLVPVLFSDLRFKPEMIEFSPRQTFIDIDDTSLRSLKTCLFDKNKIFLNRTDGHGFFQVFENGQKLSTGLNVILGERSSGKTYTLKTIARLYDNIKYIKQFELLETDEEADKKKFDELLTTKRSGISEQFLKEFKIVVEDVSKIEASESDKKVSQFLDSLFKVAADEEKLDVYSRCTLFNEAKFSDTNNDTLKNLIAATETILQNIEHRDLINKHISRKVLLELLIDLMQKFKEEHVKTQKRLWVNSVVSNIKNELQSSTASAHVRDVDFYTLLLEKEKLKKFALVANLVKREKTIEQTDVRRFKIVASTQKFRGAQELINKSGMRTVFSAAFEVYDSPLEYLSELKKIERLPETEYYKYFINIKYNIVNEFGAEVSGGERSEFNLLDKIKNAHHCDLLLIDEPESSFDNLFLKNEVNELVRQIAKTIPVIIVTHNNTVGASIKPDYILYTKKLIIESKPVYKIFSGYPSDLKLKTIDGDEISNYDIMLNCLEAGDSAYNERSQSYEILKN